MPVIGAGAPILGKNCQAYVCPDLTTPVWTGHGKIQGLNKTQGVDVAEVKERDLAETTVLRGHKTREISFQLTRRPGETFFDQLRDAYNAEDGESEAIVPMAIMNGDITVDGIDGYQAEFVVTQFDDDQSNDSSAVAVTIRPAANYSVAPAAVVISAS